LALRRSVSPHRHGLPPPGGPGSRFGKRSFFLSAGENGCLLSVPAVQFQQVNLNPL